MLHVVKRGGTTVMGGGAMLLRGHRAVGRLARLMPVGGEELRQGWPWDTPMALGRGWEIVGALGQEWGALGPPMDCMSMPMGGCGG